MNLFTLRIVNVYNIFLQYLYFLNVSYSSTCFQASQICYSFNLTIYKNQEADLKHLTSKKINLLTILFQTFKDLMVQSRSPFWNCSYNQYGSTDPTLTPRTTKIVEHTWYTKMKDDWKIWGCTLHLHLVQHIFKLFIITLLSIFTN